MVLPSGMPCRPQSPWRTPRFAGEAKTLCLSSGGHMVHISMMPLLNVSRNINMEIKEGSLIAVVGKVILIQDPTNWTSPIPQGGCWKVLPPLGAAGRDGSDRRGGKCEGRGRLCRPAGRPGTHWSNNKFSFRLGSETKLWRRTSCLTSRSVTSSTKRYSQDTGVKAFVNPVFIIAH